MKVYENLVDSVWSKSVGGAGSGLVGALMLAQSAYEETVDLTSSSVK